MNVYDIDAQKHLKNPVELVKTIESVKAWAKNQSRFELQSAFEYAFTKAENARSTWYEAAWVAIYQTIVDIKRDKPND